MQAPANKPQIITPNKIITALNMDILPGYEWSRENGQFHTEGAAGYCGVLLPTYALSKTFAAALDDPHVGLVTVTY
jgi:hypothetical protein